MFKDSEKIEEKNVGSNASQVFVDGNQIPFVRPAWKNSDKSEKVKIVTPADLCIIGSCEVTPPAGLLALVVADDR